MKPYNFVLCILSCCLFLGCSPRVVVQPEPDWLTVDYPKPGEVVRIQGSETKVCFTIFAHPLIEQGDFFKPKDIVDMTNVLIDNNPTNIDNDTLRTKSLIVYLRKGGTEPGFIIGSTPPNNEQYPITAEATDGPYSWCVVAPLKVGLHEVNVSFRKTSGEIVSYEWAFNLIDEPVPTSTPFPTAEFVNQVPDYIQSVFPLPGENYKILTNPAALDNSISLSRGMGILDYSSSQQPVCVILALDTLKQYGSLPKNFDYPVTANLDNIYLSVDGEQFSWEHVINYYDNHGRSQCVLIPASQGKHIATFYVRFLDNQLLVYSWAFTLSSEVQTPSP